MSEVLQFSPHGAPPPSEFDLNDLVPEVCDGLERESLRRRVSLEADVPPYTILRADRDKVRLLLGRALSAVLTMAPPGSQAVVTAEIEEGEVEIEIALTRAKLRGQPGGQASASQDQIQAVWSDVRRMATELGSQLSLADAGQSGMVCTLRFPRVTDEEMESQKAAA
jgi:hypothetical protein